jgi:hypothetical protein
MIAMTKHAIRNRHWGATARCPDPQILRVLKARNAILDSQNDLESRDPRPVRRALVYTSSKGGPGKSTSALAAVAALRRHRIVSAHDLDKTSGSSSRLYVDHDPIVGIAQEDITQRRNMNWLRALDTDADDVLWDVPGGRLDALTQNFAGGPKQLAQHVRESGRRLVVVTVVGCAKPQLASVFDSVEAFEDQVDHVIMMYGLWGEPEDFEVYFGVELEDGRRRFGTVREAAKKVKATEIYLPALLRGSYAACDHEDVSFEHAAAHPSKLTCFGHPERARLHIYNVRYWLDQVETCFRGTILDANGHIPHVTATNDVNTSNDSTSLVHG